MLLRRSLHKRKFNFITHDVKRHTTTIKKSRDTYMDIACNVMFTQMSAKAGINKFGETTIAAMLKKLSS